MTSMPDSLTRRAAGAVIALAVVTAACGGDEPAVEAVDEIAATTVAAPTVPAATTTSTLAPVELAVEGTVVVTVPPVTVREPLTVAVVGDSLTLAASEQIDVALNAIGMEVLAIDGVESRRMVGGAIPPGVDAIERILATGDEPDVWVVALGTNDIGAKLAGDAAAADITTLLALLPADAPVVWINTWIRNQAGDAALFNNEIRKVLESRPSAGIVNWYENAKDDEALIVSDGIHLTDLGEARFAAQMAAGIIDLVGR